MESSTRFRSHSLRLRQRDLDDAPSGRQERDEEVEAALLSLEKSQRRPSQTNRMGPLANHFCRDFRILVRSVTVLRYVWHSALSQLMSEEGGSRFKLVVKLKALSASSVALLFVLLVPYNLNTYSTYSK